METTPVVGLLLLTGKEGKRACHLASEAQRWANRHCKVPLILNFPDLSNNQSIFLLPFQITKLDSKI